jgi:hypothetical protein
MVTRKCHLDYRRNGSNQKGEALFNLYIDGKIYNKKPQTKTAICTKRRGYKCVGRQLKCNQKKKTKSQSKPSRSKAVKSPSRSKPKTQTAKINKEATPKSTRKRAEDYVFPKKMSEVIAEMIKGKKDELPKKTATTSTLKPLFEKNYLPLSKQYFLNYNRQPAVLDDEVTTYDEETKFFRQIAEFLNARNVVINPTNYSIDELSNAIKYFRIKFGGVPTDIKDDKFSSKNLANIADLLNLPMGDYLAGKIKKKDQPTADNFKVAEILDIPLKKYSPLTIDTADGNVKLIDNPLDKLIPSIRRLERAPIENELDVEAKKPPSDEMPMMNLDEPVIIDFGSLRKRKYSSKLLPPKIKIPVLDEPLHQSKLPIADLPFGKGYDFTRIDSGEYLQKDNKPKVEIEDLIYEIDDNENKMPLLEGPPIVPQIAWKDPIDITNQSILSEYFKKYSPSLPTFNFDNMKSIIPFQQVVSDIVNIPKQIVNNIGDILANPSRSNPQMKRGFVSVEQPGEDPEFFYAPRYKIPKKFWPTSNLQMPTFDIGNPFQFQIDWGKKDEVSNLLEGSKEIVPYRGGGRKNRVYKREKMSSGMQLDLTRQRIVDIRNSFIDNISENIRGRNKYLPWW